MNNKELFDMLEDYARKYRLECKESIIRNKHMNELKPNSVKELKQAHIDAILVDYINFMAGKKGGDLGLTTKYLKKK